jgi:polysaccharide biosynthesis transport protein
MNATTPFSSSENQQVPSRTRTLRRSGRSCLSLLGWICGGLLLIAALGFGVWWLTWPKYTVTASLRIAATEPCFLSTNAKRYAPHEFAVYKNSQKHLLTNRLVLNAALHRQACSQLPSVKSQTEPVEWLESQLQISFPEDSEIMQVSLSGDNRKELAILVNAVVDAYLDEVIEAERKKRDDRLSMLKVIQVSKTDEVKTALSDLRRMADSLGTSDSETLNIKQKNTLDELVNLRSEFIRNQFVLNRMNGKLASLKAKREALQSMPISDVSCELFASSDIVLKKLEDEMISRKLAADARAKAELETLKKEYAQRLDQIREEIHRSKLADTELEIKKTEAETEILKKQNAISQEELKQLRKDSDRFGMSSIDMQLRRMVIANAQKSLDAITLELDTLSIESRSPPRVTIVQKAE